MECLLDLAQSLHDNWLPVSSMVGQDKYHDENMTSREGVFNLCIAKAELTSHRKNIEATLERSHGTGVLVIFSESDKVLD